MKVLPQASAMGNIHSGTMAGKLNGVMPATTPSGWRMDQVSMPVPTCSVYSPLRSSGIPVAYSMFSRPRMTSPLASEKTLPCSRLSRAAISSMRRLEDVAEAEEDAGAAERWLRRPLGEGGGGGLDGLVEFSGGGHRDAGLNGAGGGVVDVAEAGRFVDHGRAGDPVRDGAKGLFGVGDCCASGVAVRVAIWISC